MNSELDENQQSMWIEDVKCPILNCLDVDFQTKYKIRLIFVPTLPILERIIESETSFFQEIAEIKVKNDLNLKILYAYIFNWLKMNLYNTGKEFDPIGAFEMK